jgi:hypothetical protein
MRNRNVYISAVTLLYAVALALVAKFQPYKHKMSNTVDIVMLLTLITGTVLASDSIKSAIGINYPKWVPEIALAIVSLIPLSYILLLALSRVGPHALQCFRRSKVFLLERISQTNEVEGEEEPALLTHETSGYYNTFPN